MPAPYTPGLFIVFEGIGGCGKTTQLSMLAQYFAKHHDEWGFSGLTTTKEPSSNPIGRYVREQIVGGKQSTDAMTQALLFTAARRQHVQELLEPALAKNEVVLCDRYFHSSFVYQFPQLWTDSQLNLNEEDLLRFYSWGTNSLEPDLTLFIDTPAETCAERISKRGVVDHFDRDIKELSKQRNIYRRGIYGCDFYPTDMEIIDGVGTAEEVHARVLERVLRECVIKQTQRPVTTAMAIPNGLHL